MATGPTVALHGRSLIGYELGTSSSVGFAAVDPVTGAALPGNFQEASPEEVDRAALLADTAFAGYSRLPGEARGAFLRRIADGIEGLGETLVERAVAETALPAARIQAERTRTCHQLRLFAELVEEEIWVEARIDRALPNRQPPRPDIRSCYRAVGPVVVFGASNFPLAFSVAGGDTAAALAAGCPVIVKAHPGHPGTSEMVGRAIVEAAKAGGLPPGVFALLFGAGNSIGQHLVRHPLVKAGAFTGSRAGGTALMRIAANRPEPIPFFAEMSSVNPVFMLPEIVDREGPVIAAGLHASLTLGVGQFCTNPGLIFLVDDAAGREFLARLEALIAATPAGTMLSTSISQGYLIRLARHRNLPGVRGIVAAAGARASAQGPAALLVTTSEVFRTQPSLAEEVFGPAGLVVLCRHSAEFVELAARLEGQLTATVWGRDAELQAQALLLATLERKAGRLLINGFPTGVEVCSSMVHGGPFPATSDGRFTSVGTRSIYRFVRPVAYQGFPESLLPPELRPVDPMKLGVKWVGT